MKALISPILQKMSFLKTEGIRQALVYFLAILVFFLALVFVDKLLADMDTLPHLLFFMAAIVIMGLVNVWLLKKPLYDNIPAWLKALLTLTATLVGAVFFMAISSYSLVDPYGKLILPALILYALPWFFQLALQAILAIPILEYLPLQITNLKDIVAQINWAEDETKGIVWEFENLPEMAIKGQYWVRTHTPFSVNDIKFKDLFKCLLSLHNHNLCPGQPIHFDDGEQYFGWRFFYQKDYFFWKKRIPLDPEKNLRQNGMRFHLLSKKERVEMENVRKGLSKKFRKATIMIVRCTE